ncbi:MAG: PAS domain S-box protein, partial [Proteobacteria bacterium]|nr:PAS domain S-box protein [Pseudomonadota bacterium]
MVSRKTIYRVVKQKDKNMFVYLLACLMVLSFATTTYSQNKTKKRILILHSYHNGQHWNDKIAEGIESVLKDNGHNIEFFFEYMDTKRFYDDRHLENLYQLLNYKYRNKTLDVIISSDDHAFNFLLNTSDTLFPGIPIVFCGINRLEESSMAGQKLFTGVAESTDLEKTIEIAMQLHPKTKNIYVLVDKTISGMAHRRQIEDIIPHFDKTVTFNPLEDVEISLIKKNLQELQKDSIVLWMNLFSDKNRNPISLDDGSMLLTKYCDVPVYSLWENRLGKGIVGGKLISGYDQGKTAAMMAWRILQGEKVENIPIVYKSPNPYKFDYKQMSRFDIEFSDLPAGSVVVNQTFSFYSENTRLVWGVAVSIIGLVAIIVILSLNIHHRKKAEEALRESEERFSLFMDYLPAVVFIKDKDGRSLFVNKYLDDNLGAKDWIGKTVFEQFPKDIAEAMQADDIKTLTEGYRIIDEIVPDKQGINHIYQTYKFRIERSGKPVLLGGIALDVTERKQAEKALRKSEEKLRLLTEMAPVGVFVTDDKGLTTYWNKKLCEITGMSVVDGMGTGWADGVHPDDRERVFGEWYESEEKRSSFYSEYRFVNKEGVVTHT